MGLPYLLTAGELELGTTQSLDDLRLPTVAGAHRHDGLSNAHTRYGTLGLAESTTHSSLEPEIYQFYHKSIGIMLSLIKIQ